MTSAALVAVISQRTEHFPVDVEAFNHLSEHFPHSNSQQRANTLTQPVPIPVMIICWLYCSGEQKRNVQSAAEDLVQMLKQQCPVQSESPVQSVLPYARCILLPQEAEQIQPFILGEPK